MDTQSSLKNKVAKEVLDQLLNDLGTYKITVPVAKQIARDTLNALDKIESHEKSLVDFYADLSVKHEPFKMLYTKVKGEVLRSHEENAYRDALSAIHSGDVGTAQQIASGALTKTANETAST